MVSTLRARIGRSAGPLARSATGVGNGGGSDEAAHGAESSARRRARRGGERSRDEESDDCVRSASASSAIGGNGAAGGSARTSSTSIEVMGSGGGARINAAVGWMVEASASVRVVIGAGSDGVIGGGRITGTGSAVGGCDVEPPASFGANNAERNRAQPAA